LLQIYSKAEIQQLCQMRSEELYAWAGQNQAPMDLVLETARLRRLPVPNFAAGGVATPADAALLMQLGAEAVFVGSGIFMSSEPAKRAAAIVQAVTHFDKPKVLAELSRGLGTPMRGIDGAAAMNGGKTVTLKN
jgi:pyridoxal 5'-phosphate synthase pdxS subunit